MDSWHLPSKETVGLHNRLRWFLKDLLGFTWGSYLHRFTLFEKVLDFCFKTNLALSIKSMLFTIFITLFMGRCALFLLHWLLPDVPGYEILLSVLLFLSNIRWRQSLCIIDNFLAFHSTLLLCSCWWLMSHKRGGRYFSGIKQVRAFLMFFTILFPCLLAYLAMLENGSTTKIAKDNLLSW